MLNINYIILNSMYIFLKVYFMSRLYGDNENKDSKEVKIFFSERAKFFVIE